MADNVGVDAVGEMEADGQSARVCVRIVVWDDRNPGGVGEAHRDRCVFADEMRRPRERFGIVRRGENAREHGALGVCGAEARIESPYPIKLLQQIVGKG
jgi:hypothetical protein